MAVFGRRIAASALCDKANRRDEVRGLMEQRAGVRSGASVGKNVTGTPQDQVRKQPEAKVFGGLTSQRNIQVKL